MKREMISIYRKDFLAFATMALRKLDGTILEDAPYLELMASDAMDFEEGKVKRLIENIPPRHGKTKMFSICLPAWIRA